jgi:hypothetical protein
LIKIKCGEWRRATLATMSRDDLYLAISLVWLSAVVVIAIVLLAA